MREHLLSKQEPEFDDLGNSQPIQIVKDTKIMRFTVRKACSGEKTMGVICQRGIKFADGNKVDN